MGMLATTTMTPEIPVQVISSSTTMMQVTPIKTNFFYAFLSLIASS